jgi:ribosomal protein S27AE
MICPRCGVEMNCHAIKLNPSAAETNSTLVDPDLGGVLEEAHSCPRCGRTETVASTIDSSRTAGRT